MKKHSIYIFVASVLASAPLFSDPEAPATMNWKVTVSPEPQPSAELKHDLNPKPDEVETLIQGEETEDQKWSESEGDLPPMNMLGDQKGFLVYSAPNERAHDSLLCSSIEFDEILEPDSNPGGTSDIEVNTAKPRIRETLADNCLIRPGDPLVAVGPGWQELVSAKNFLIRPGKTLCTNDPPYSLWMSFDGALPSDPFFFSTDIQLPVGSNGFKAAGELAMTSFDSHMAAKVAEEIKFLDEYTATVFKLDAPNCDRIIYLKKKVVSPNDAELPNEAILSEKDGGVELLLIEKVDPQHGSGHLHVEGVMDFNGDHNLDLLLSGDHQNCPFRVVLQGQEIGFERLELPFLACSCL